MDEATKNILLMNKDVDVPRNETALREWCRPMVSLSRRMSEHARCEKPFPAQIVKILSNTLKRPIKFLCQKNRKETVETFNCMSKEYTLRIRNETTQFLKVLDYVASNLTQDETLPMFCCAFAEIIERVEVKIESPKCSNPGIVPSRFLVERLRSVVDDIFDLICGPYKTVAICEEKVPKNMTSLRRAALSDSDTAHGVFLPNVLKAINNLA
ncbi:uncharacterized protein LOC141855231 isoform X2 [Brevipalpus obovatus]